MTTYSHHNAINKTGNKLDFWVLRGWVGHHRCRCRCRGRLRRIVTLKGDVISSFSTSLSHSNTNGRTRNSFRKKARTGIYWTGLYTFELIFYSHYSLNGKRFQIISVKVKMEQVSVHSKKLIRFEITQYKRLRRENEEMYTIVYSHHKP